MGGRGWSETEHPVTDADLIQSIQAGDETALETLYREYLPSVWRYACARLAGNFAGAEDVVSETFLAAVRQVRGLDPRSGSVGGWLIGIARHKVGDVRRRQYSRPTVAAEEWNTGTAEGSDPPAALEAVELRACVGGILDGLADEERLALEWKYLDGLSVREIAGRLGRSEKAAEAILYRARNAFRAAYERAQRPAK
jgi:RNA polymerase sigma-70 factor (ECF subfamily)